jgi:hypothetical protein
LKVRSPSSVNYKLKWVTGKSAERGPIQGPFTNTVRTPTDKSVWGIYIPWNMFPSPVILGNSYKL